MLKFKGSYGFGQDRLGQQRLRQSWQRPRLFEGPAHFFAATKIFWSKKGCNKLSACVCVCACGCVRVCVWGRGIDCKSLQVCVRGAHERERKREVVKDHVCACVCLSVKVAGGMIVVREIAIESSVCQWERERERVERRGKRDSEHVQWASVRVCEWVREIMEVNQILRGAQLSNWIWIKGVKVKKRSLALLFQFGLISKPALKGINWESGRRDASSAVSQGGSTWHLACLGTARTFQASESNFFMQEYPRYKFKPFN